jgi:hypothetical protein
MSKYSLTLNLIVCRKRQLNPGRISLLKRKAQHRKKRIQRKKHGKVSNAESPVHSAGLLFTPLEFWFKTSSTKFSLQRLKQTRERINNRERPQIISVWEDCAQRSALRKFLYKKLVISNCKLYKINKGGSSG